jgi:hypothetical protein
MTYRRRYTQDQTNDADLMNWWQSLSFDGRDKALDAVGENGTIKQAYEHSLGLSHFAEQLETPAAKNSAPTDSQGGVA